MEDLEILTYRPEFAEDFKKISYSWIEKYFGIEQEDREVVEHPESAILAKGGQVLFARWKGEIVGACALIRLESDIFELAKLGVLEAYHGLGIGKKLSEAIIELAKSMGGSYICLESSQELEAALDLYYKLGFTAGNNLKESPYSRCNIQLSLNLNEYGTDDPLV